MVRPDRVALPILVRQLSKRKVTAVALGAFHSLFLTTDGQASHLSHSFSDKRLLSLTDIGLTSVLVQQLHCTCCILDQRPVHALNPVRSVQVLSVGESTDGRLGRTVEDPSDIYPDAAPVENLGDSKITGITAGMLAAEAQAPQLLCLSHST